MRLSIGAILMVTVPETIIRSEWRGEAQGTIPKRSTSKREAKVAIISMAQQASPNVTGQIDELRAQLKIFSVEVVTSHRQELLELTDRIRALEGVMSTETFFYLEMWKQLYDWGTRR